MKASFALRGVLGDAPAQRVVTVLRRAIRRFGANQAVIAIVLVAGDDLAGLATFFFDQVTGDRAITKLSDSRLGNASLRTITLIVATRNVQPRTPEILFSLKNRHPYRYQKNEAGDL